MNPYQTQLSLEGRDVGLSHIGWPQLAAKHRWWPWLAHNAPFLWADQQWLGWSHNSYLSDCLKSVIQWQNLLKGLFIDELVPARTAGCHRACVWLLLNPCIRHSLWHRSQYLFEGSANSISGRWSLWFYQYQNVLPKGHRDVDWWFLFEWL